MEPWSLDSNLHKLLTPHSPLSRLLFCSKVACLLAISPSLKEEPDKGSWVVQKVN